MGNCVAKRRAVQIRNYRYIVIVPTDQRTVEWNGVVYDTDVTPKPYGVIKIFNKCEEYLVAYEVQEDGIDYNYVTAYWDLLRELNDNGNELFGKLDVDSEFIDLWRSDGVKIDAILLSSDNKKFIRLHETFWQSQLEVSNLIDFGLKFVQALHEYHQRGKVHLNLSPTSVFVETKGDRSFEFGFLQNGHPIPAYHGIPKAEVQNSIFKLTDWGYCPMAMHKRNVTITDDYESFIYVLYTVYHRTHVPWVRNVMNVTFENQQYYENICQKIWSVEMEQDLIKEKRRFWDDPQKLFAHLDEPLQRLFVDLAMVVHANHDIPPLEMNSLLKQKLLDYKENFSFT
ncbi:unnamed protein product [Bursaphelenchus xylophilus]|uniref:(pine wood nematode) hypothetical protein n=1 Tax=Bursaphelenchus xylophilus TaxID=6326 RepID=A0A1I7SS43_BURXY|nr:unnamed protein product [Bursaphelenchus xylophilus]CAG9105697.1 unnamed protein product [Bursaphelenchus xylophilus]